MRNTGEKPPVQRRNARFARRLKASRSYATYQGNEYHRVLTPWFENKMRQLLKKRAPDAVIAVPKGNEYAAISLINYPEPFTIGGTGPEAVPSRVMAAQVRYRAETGALLHWRFLSEDAAVPVLFVPPPPPIRSEEHLRAYPGAFADAIAEYGVPPADLRQQIYSMYVDQLREAVTSGGGHFFDLPDEVSEDGFLAEQYVGPDPIHANMEYGAVLLRHLQPALDAILSKE